MKENCLLFLLLLLCFSCAQPNCVDVSFSSVTCGSLQDPVSLTNITLTGNGNLWGVPLGCSFKLGQCDAKNFLTAPAIGCNSGECVLNFTLSSPVSSFSISGIWQTTNTNSPVVISVSTSGGQIQSQSISRTDSDCETPSTFEYTADTATQRAAWFTISGVFQLVNGIKLCNGASLEVPCVDTPLYLYTGEAGCSPVLPNQCFTCGLENNTFYYKANCTTLPSGVCSCRSFIYEGIYCEGKVLPQPAVNQTCTEIRTFYPNQNTTCTVLANPPPPDYNIAVYGGGDSTNCTTFPTSTCFPCSQNEVIAYYKAKCTKENVCFMTQYIDKECTHRSGIFPIPVGDCDDLYAGFSQFKQPICAFGVPPLSSFN